MFFVSPLHSGAIFSLPAVPQRVRRLSSTRSSPKWRGPLTAWCLLRIRASFSVRRPTWSRCVPKTAWRRSLTWCVPRCGCGPTASRSVRYEEPKHSICLKRGAPAILAVSIRSMPAPRSAPCGASSSSCRRPWSLYRERSSPRPSTSSPCLPAAVTNGDLSSLPASMVWDPPTITSSCLPWEPAHDPPFHARPSEHIGNRDLSHCECSDHARIRSGIQHALGTAASADPAVDRGARLQDRRCDHHHRNRSHARLWRHGRRLQAPHSDRLWPLDRVRGVILLPVVLLVRWRGARVMNGISNNDLVPGFEAPVHRALTEPILLAGAPRAIAILNGTLSAAIGLGLRLWIAGLVRWVIGHLAAVWAAKRDPSFVEVVRRHVRYPLHLGA